METSDVIETNWDETVSSFDAMELKEELLRGIYAYGFERPSKIQEKAIIPIIRGRNIIAQAQSGTGKTGTFGIGILERIDTSVDLTQALVLAPTRELVDQIAKVINELGNFLNVRVEKFIGGTSLKEDIGRLRNGVHVVVGTPGRIEDLVSKEYINLEHLKIFVLDEADEMFSKGFIEQVNKIFIRLDEDVQVAMFSATLTNEVKQLVDKIMGEPVKIYIPLNEQTLDGIPQFYIKLDDKQKFSAIKNLYNKLVLGTTIIFCNSIKTVDWLTQLLISNDFAANSIHGGMSQDERDEKLKLLRKGQIRLLVTTDVLSRGIDVQQLSMVVNFDLPFEPETYIHRIGRCGRYGRKGLAINLISSRDENKLDFIESYYNTKINEFT
jgi:translation initiation factor 4A